MGSREVIHYLRDNPTGAEILLWQALRNRQLDGHKFRRQHPIGPFVVDFGCLKARLVIEVDGQIHHSRVGADAEQERLLRIRGYDVLRLTNDEVLANLDTMLARIHEALTERTSPPAAATPSPSLSLGEGDGG